MAYKTYKKTQKTSLFSLFMDFPWWFNCVLALLVLAIPFYLASSHYSPDNLFLVQLVPYTPLISRIIAGILGIMALFGFFSQRKGKRLFNAQNEIKDLYRISWEDFEHLVREVFARMHYKVKKRGGPQADGGVDLEAYKNGSKIIIQCKHWKSNKVGVSVVREMFGVMIHEKAEEVYIITCGAFTKDAKEFAQGKPVYLVHGFKLLNWIKAIKNGSPVYLK